MKVDIICPTNLRPRQYNSIIKYVQDNISRFQHRKYLIKKIRVKIHTYRTAGFNKMHSVNLVINFNGRKFEVDSKSWKLESSLRNCFEKIRNEIEHTYHVSDFHHVRKNKHGWNKRAQEDESFEELLRYFGFI